MQFLKVGHFTQQQKGTGATVFLFEKPAVGAYILCGSSPASHELAALNLDANVSHIDGLAFLGGSAFGLSAVDGVMRWFKEQGRGHPTPHGAVPIVPAVGIYDLAVKQPIPPTSDEIYEACRSATENNISQGRIGAGTGASVGKFVPFASRMSGGLGCAELALPNGVSVLVYAVVNSLGDVRDKHENIIAGARLPNGEFADCEKYLLSGRENAPLDTLNTTLIAVFTNGFFSKIELARIAKVASSGMARAISPVFTRYDGDIVFCFSLGERLAREEVVSTMAAEAVRQAIINSVKDSIIL